MAITKLSNLDTLRNYLTRDWPRKITEVVLHHTWAPTAAQYRGQATWDGIRRYHMDVRGWSDIGYHLGVGPDGSMWRLRDMGRSGAHVLNRNAHSVGVAMVGNFDVEDPALNGLATAAQVVRAVCDRFALPASAVRFHREFQDKTCPGTRLNLAEFRRLVFGSVIVPGEQPRPKLTSTVDGVRLDLGAWVDDKQGISYGPLRAVVTALGGTITYDGTANQIRIERARLP